MRLIKIMERGGDDYREYKKALKKAKEAIETICDLSEEMEDQYSERDDEEWDDEEWEKRKLRKRMGSRR